MIELRLLGSVDLAGIPANAAAVLRQPKRLALLAYLGLAGRTGFVRRDVVLALFWPELDETRARAALRQALHFLRQQLGDDLFETRGDDLAVSADHVRADVVAFDEALAAERWTEAAALYRGPLLEGFHPAGVGAAFEDWLTRERARLHDGARLAVDELGRAAEAGGDARGAVRWARRAVDLDPMHDATTRRLMRLLESLGDPGGALEMYEALERRLHEERGTAPSSTTVTLADACRSAVAPVGPVVAPASGGAPSTQSTPAVVSASAATAPLAASTIAETRTADAPMPARRATARRRRRPRPVVLASFALLLVVLASGLGWWAGHTDVAAESMEPIRVAVLPFEQTGQGNGTLLVDGMTEAVTARLASLSRLEVIDPQSTAQYRGSRATAQAIGAQLDVQYVLRSTVQWVPTADGMPTVRITPVLVRVADGVVRWTGVPYLVTPRDMFTVQTEIAGDVATALDVTLTRDERRTLALQPTADPDAYRDYLEGMERLREWRNYMRRDDLLQSAGDLFARASMRDTTFALAYARLAEVRLEQSVRSESSTGRDSRFMQAFQSALDRARRLDPDLPEAIAVHGLYLARVARDTAAAFAEFERASALRPDDAELLINRVRSPDSRGAQDRDIALLERALRLDPRSHRALDAIGNLLAGAGRYAEADHFTDRRIAVDSSGWDGYLAGARAALLARGDTSRAQWLIAAGMRRSSAPRLLLREFHMLGDEFARSLDTLSLEQLERGVAATRYDSASYLRAKFEAAARLGGHQAVRAAADAYLRIIAREPAPQGRAHQAAPVYAALGRRADAEREARLSEEHLDAQVRAMFAGGDTVAALRIQARIGYDLARAYARAGNARKMALHLRRALTAPGGVTPHYVRLDPAFRQWLGRPELEVLLTDPAGSP